MWLVHVSFFFLLSCRSIRTFLVLVLIFYVSVENPDTKFIDATLIHDLWPEHAAMWQNMTSSKLELVPAERPTLTLSPTWIHGLNPTLVTIQKVESLQKISVADLACSLRACLLQEILYEAYSSEAAKVLQICNPLRELGINVIVVAYDESLDVSFFLFLLHIYIVFLI